MTEWQISIDSDNLPGPDKPGRFRRQFRRWYLIVVAFLVLLIVGAVIVQRHRVARQAALREDLTAVIFEEETVRFMGLPDQADRFMLPTASSVWQQAYRQSFKTDGNQSSPDSIHIEDIDFDGQCATVAVALDGYEHVRAYCLTDRQWRRAPVLKSDWGEEEQVIDIAGGTRLEFKPPDQPFAAALATDLPALFEALEQWPTDSGVTNSPQLAASQPAEIRIEPHDLHSPLVVDDGRRLVINSPLLVPFDGNSLPSGQVAVRLAVAKALLRRAGLPPNEIPDALPGADRFVDAVQTVIAADLILPPDAHQQLSETWRSQLDGEWVSPLFADSLPTETSMTGQQAEVAAYLTAEYVYRSQGLNTIATLLQGLPATDSWDALFQATLNRTTVALETEAAAYARSGDLATVLSVPSDDQLTAAELPFSATLQDVSRQSTGHLRAYVELPDLAESVLVEMPADSNFGTSGGGSIPPACIPAGANLQIEGDWLEVGRRVRATGVTVQEITALAIEPAPADSVAYLVEGEPPPEPDLAASYVFPSNRSFFIPSSLLLPRGFVALRADGSLQPLTPLSSTLRVVSLPIPAEGAPHFLFILDLPGCERSWFIHYEPRRGVTGQWLGPLPPMNWVWRADRQDLMFFDPRPGSAGHNIYQTNDIWSFQPLSQSATPVSFTGWNVPAGRLVFIKRSWVGATGIGLLDPDSGAMRRAKLYLYPLRARRLSPDGNWLAYLTGVRNRLDPPYRLDLLNLESLAEITLVQLAANEGMGPAIWSPYLAQPRLAVLAGPVTRGDILRPTRLLVASPDQPEQYVTMVEATSGAHLAMPVFCEDGRLLYRVDHEGEFRLVSQRPGQGAELLLTLDQPFQPLACS